MLRRRTSFEDREWKRGHKEQKKAIDKLKAQGLKDEKERRRTNQEMIKAEKKREADEAKMAKERKRVEERRRTEGRRSTRGVGELKSEEELSEEMNGEQAASKI